MGKGLIKFSDAQANGMAHDFEKIPHNIHVLPTWKEVRQASDAISFHAIQGIGNQSLVEAHSLKKAHILIPASRS
jgi:hypothetical protein